MDEEQEQPLKRAKTEIILDKNADFEDLISSVTNKIERVELENIRVLSVPKPLEVFDKQFLQAFFVKSCEVIVLLIVTNDVVFEE